MSTFTELPDRAETGTATGMGHLVEPDTIDVSHGAILYLEDVTVRFGGFRALNALTLSIDHGELRCIIGPNGAGKTTMMDVITGKTGPRNADVTGRVFLGQSIDLLRLTEPRIAQIGIGRKFQKPTVFEQHTVWENLELAMKADKRWWVSLRARLLNDGRQRIEETLGRIHLEAEAYRPAGLLSHGQKQRLEIGMLLMQQPQLLLLDEPVAGMNTGEKVDLMAEIENIKARGYTIFMIEHDMRFVMGLCERIAVLNFGRIIAEGPPDAIRNNPQVIEAYLGRDDDEAEEATA